MPSFTSIVFAAGALLFSAGAQGQAYTTDPDQMAPPMFDGDVPIIEPRNMALYDTLGYPDALTPVISIEHHDALSYDVTYSFKNTSAFARPIGRLEMGIFGLGERLRVLDHASSMAWRDISHGEFQGYSWCYPGHAYSPVMVAMNQTHVIGVSLLYPVMDYRHDAAVQFNRVGGVFRGPAERLGWMVSFDLNNYNGPNARERVHFGAELLPGESREYTMAVRVMKRPQASGSVAGEQEWLEVLEPYRSYFQSNFGSVTYERRTKPVMTWAFADESNISPTNRRGFGGNENRPDRVGFAPAANSIINANAGYESVMIWVPSGLYATNREHNLPYRFTAGWLDQEKLRTATDSIGLPAIPRSGMELGLWWGRAAQYMDRWDGSHTEFLDMSNPQHMNSVYQQLDLAQQAGATMIGLDAFTHERMPSWDQIEYITGLQQRYPEMSFIVEPIASDLVNRITPTFLKAWQSHDEAVDETDMHRVNTPHYLSDLVLPGHEIWGYFRYPNLTASMDNLVSSERLQRDTERLARNGYIPIMASRVPLRNPQLATADATWLTTVPSMFSEPTPPNGDGGGGGDGTDDGDSGDNGNGDRSGDNSGDSGGTGDEGDKIPPPGGEDDKPTAKPDDNLEPKRVFVITLPDGRRLKIKRDR